MPKIVSTKEIDALRKHLDDIENGLPVPGYIALFNPPDEPWAMVSGTIEQMTSPARVSTTVKQFAFMMGKVVGQLFNDSQDARAQLLAVQQIMRDLRTEFENGLYDALRKSLSPEARLRITTAEEFSRIKDGGIITKPN